MFDASLDGYLSTGEAHLLAAVLVEAVDRLHKINLAEPAGREN